MKVVAFAYACEPGEGSESAAGWGSARMLARLGEIWVITLPLGRRAIESRLADLPERENLHFVYVDLPSWLSFSSWRHRGIRLRYLIWQLYALRAARRLHREQSFDLAWHLTFANAWLGSLAGSVGPPFVYGPVGGTGRVPWRLFTTLGLAGAGYELVRLTAQMCGRYLNPLARIAWLRANVILAQNQSTVAWLPRRHRTKALVFPHAVLDDAPPLPAPTTKGALTAVYAGRLLAFKGLALAIRAVAAVPQWRLIICGSGPDEARLRRVVSRLGVDDRVEFRGWLAQDEVRSAMNQADVLLFPSLHDEAPFAVVEALGAGLEVICLDLGGPPALIGPAGSVVPANGTSRQVIDSLAAELRERADARGGQTRTPVDRASEFVVERRAGRLRELLEGRTA
jgi:glycosyltransferase involved in cell wall biosynthesis